MIKSEYMITAIKRLEEHNVIKLVFFRGEIHSARNIIMLFFIVMALLIFNRYVSN